MERPVWQPESRATPQHRRQWPPYIRCAALAPRKNCPGSFFSTTANGCPSAECSKGHPYISRQLSRMRSSSPGHAWIRSTELNPIVGGKFENILNGNCGRLSWSNRVVGCKNGRCFQKLFEPGGRKHDEIVI